MSSAPLVTQEFGAVETDPFRPGVARRREIVGKLDVGVEANPDAVGGRRRPPPFGIHGRRRPMVLAVISGARELLLGRIENQRRSRIRR